MACNPDENNITVPEPTPPPNIGNGVIFSPPQIPFPDITIPQGFPESVLELIENITMKIPGGELKANFDDSFRTVFSAIASLLNQLGPYLAFYNFFQALLEMIMCIINVLCSLLNPFAVIGALIRLFKHCIPNFLSIFPFIALIAMILAFIILLITLIEFLINYITGLINQIIENINTLSEAFSTGDEQGILAITQKIASLLCLVEQAFALLIAFQALFVIIQSLAALGGSAPCVAGRDECCADEFCPPFILQTSGIINGSQGRLVYHKEVGQDIVGAGLPSFLQVPSFRSERWQFVNDGGAPFEFKDIITPINGNIYWPETYEFTKDNNLITTVPYTLDLRLFINPSVFNNNIADGYARHFRIQDTIVTIKPYIGVYNHGNALNYSADGFGNSNGTLQLTGGLVYEDDGITPVLDTSGTQLSLDTFIKQDKINTFFLPTTEDGYSVQNIEYVWKVNHTALFKYQLISAGCNPAVASEANVVNQTFDTTDILTKISRIQPELTAVPDLNTALSCLDAALAIFREDISLESAAIFQSSVNACLNTLKDNAELLYSTAFTIGASVYKTQINIDPEVQFVSSSIGVSVVVKDAGGNDIGGNLPQNLAQELSAKLKAYVTLGTVSDFTYDGTQAFVASITSNNIGTGELTASFDGNMISDILNQDNNDIPTSIDIRALSYRFVGGTGAQQAIRRDESDTANSE